jgi:hypothetical protein
MVDNITYILLKVQTPCNHPNVISKMTIQKRVVIFNLSKIIECNELILNVKDSFTIK